MNSGPRRLLADSIYDLGDELKRWPLPVVPHTIGVYFLLRRGKVVYVGQSKKMLQRIGTHTVTKEGLFDDVAWTECESRLLGILEDEWVTRLRPELNMRQRGGISDYVRRTRERRVIAAALGIADPVEALYLADRRRRASGMHEADKRGRASVARKKERSQRQRDGATT